MSVVTPEELRAFVREQIEWCEVFHQLVPYANVQEAYSSNQVSVYVTSGKPATPSGPPPHRFLYTVSPRQVDQIAFGSMLQEESVRWNALTHEERLAAAEARIGNKWTRQKLVARLAKKGFHVSSSTLTSAK